MPYTRLTVLGTTRKAELVLPNDESLGSLIPPVLELLGEQLPGGNELAVTTIVGDRLDLNRSLADQDLAHGAMIRITTVDDTPTPPQVADVTDAVAAARTTRPDRWSSCAAHASAAVAVGVLSLCSSDLANPGAPALNDLATQITLIAAVLLTAAAVFLAHRSRPGAATVLGAAIFGALIPLVLNLATPLPVTILNLAACAWVVLGIIAGAQRPSVLAGTAIALTAATATALATRWGVAEPVIHIVTALAGLAALGILPGIALALAGLTRYDDQTTLGTKPDSHNVRHAIDEGFATLTGMVIAVTVPTLLALNHLASSTNPWTMSLTTVTATAVLLRARTLPLIPQRVALYLTGGLALLSFVTTSPALSITWRLTLLLIAAGALVLSVLTRPREITAAKLRRAAEITELLLIVATIPLALGALGIYTDLLGVFR